MYASIIPAVRLPKGMMAFDYEIPPDLSDTIRRGSWVIVPWRGREVDGLVTAVSKKPEVAQAKIRPIEGMGSPLPVGEDLIETVLWLAGHYFVSPGAALKAILPKTPKRKIIREAPSAPPPKEGKRKRRAGRSVVRYASLGEKFDRTRPHVEKTIADGSGAIVVVPHTDDIPVTVRVLGESVGEDRVIALHGRLAAGEHWSVWQRILSGEPLVVVGTRVAVFAPVPRLGLIVVHEADCADLKQYDQNPRFDARTTAVRRAELAGCGLRIMGHAPRPEEYALTRDKTFTFEDSTLPEPDSTVADLSGWAAASRQGMLSPSMKDAITEALQEGKKALIFLNRRGTANLLICSDCRHVFRCERCEVARAVHAKTLHCHRCGVSSEIPLLCPECSGPALHPVGTGTATLAERLQESFPDAKIARHDADRRSGATDASEADILVGTQLLLHDIAETDLIAGGFGAVIAMNTDDLFAHPGFRVTESAWRTVRLLRDIAAGDGARLILETVDPDNLKIRNLLTDYRSYMESEQSVRKKAGYPPHATFINVTVPAEEEERAVTEASGLKQRLAGLAKEIPGMSVSGPLRPSTPFRHGKWRRSVLIKTARVPSELTTCLNSLPDRFIIDRDPESI
jgi:primosomal protein N' (replication factor Y)